MKIDIQAVHCTLDKKTRDYAAEKIGKLDRYYKNIISAEVIFECNEAQAEITKRYECKAKLIVPGKDIFGDGYAKDLKSSVDVVEEKLRAQIYKLTDLKKSNKIHRRAREIFKNFFGK